MNEKAWIDADGGLYIGADEYHCDWVAGQEGIDALRDFFRAEEDERLGRWRVPSQPHLVVYKVDGGWHVLDEADGSICSVPPTVNSAEHYGGAYRRAVEAAREYRAAHPEPKPWHDAQIDEVWLLTIDGVEEAYRTEMVSHVRFFAIRAENGMTYGTRSSEITAGRRIYPVSS